MADKRPLATPVQVAEYLEIPPETLQKWRVRREGPPFHKVGKHVRYSWQDVDRWLADQRVGGAVA